MGICQCHNVYKSKPMRMSLMKIWAHKYKCILNLMHPNECYTVIFI